MTFRLANSLNLFFSFANSFWFFNHSFWCFSCGLCLYFVSLCPEVFLQRPGVASLVGWSSGLSHTCSSSNHQRQLKYSGLPSTWWQIVSTHSHWCLWLQQLVLISCNFLLEWYFVWTTCLIFSSVFIVHLWAATRQTPLWIHLRLIHLCRHLGLYLPVASASPPAAPLAWAIINTFIITLSPEQTNKLIKTFPWLGFHFWVNWANLRIYSRGVTVSTISLLVANWLIELLNHCLTVSPFIQYFLAFHSLTLLLTNFHFFFFYII